MSEERSDERGVGMGGECPPSQVNFFNLNLPMQDRSGATSRNPIWVTGSNVQTWKIFQIHGDHRWQGSTQKLPTWQYMQNWVATHSISNPLTTLGTNWLNIWEPHRQWKLKSLLCPHQEKFQDFLLEYLHRHISSEIPMSGKNGGNKLRTYKLQKFASIRTLSQNSQSWQEELLNFELVHTASISQQAASVITILMFHGRLWDVVLWAKPRMNSTF